MMFASSVAFAPIHDDDDVSRLSHALFSCIPLRLYHPGEMGRGGGVTVPSARQSVQHVLQIGAD